MVGEVQDNVWPLPKFYFSVDISDVGQHLAFQEVTGLDIKADVIESSAGSSPVFSKIKMPGPVQSGVVTLKKGVFVKDNALFDWLSALRMNTVSRHTVTIRLLDQEGDATMVWMLSNAFPTKVTGTDLKADGNEVAVAEIELSHEGITIERS
ncbi:MAG: phage tail protein [Pseudomonadota bacterium]